MRVAIVHDYIKEYGGAERVLEALHEIWPDAPVYTTVYLPEFLGPHRERFNNWDIRTSFLQYMPFKEKLISPFRIIAPFVFGSFDFSQFDVVIVSATGAYSPNMIRVKGEGERGKPIHICYCHTPPRYLYGYATAREWKKNLIFRVLGEIGNHFLRLIDFKSAQNVDYFIANSKNVAERIKKFYRGEATVIYPPVEVDGRRWKIEDSDLKMEDRRSIDPQASTLKNLHSVIYHLSSKKSYFLAGGRLARPKHIDLIVQACEELKIPLKVFGREFAGWREEICTENRHSGKRVQRAHSESVLSRSELRDSGKIGMTDKNIEYLGEVSDEEKIELMRNAKAYIFAAEDEDFGITPVEAMSVGTPVIAYKSGGVIESVLQGRTGLFFDELSVQNLAKVIKQFNNLTINPTDCINQAQKFSKERFKREIKEFAEKYV